tara:strand:+ start:36 stop:674 length:639 start_codon:yes stop_codon:yes gene_type:complete
MPTPSSRTPVRIARGTYSNLNSSVSDIQEGEIVYATDQDKLYVKEGSSLVSTQADVATKANIASPTFTGTVTIPAGASIADIGSTIQAFDADTAKTDVTQTFTKAQRGDIVDVTGTTPSFDLNAGNNFKFTTSGNWTSFTLANLATAAEGQTGSIFIVYGGAHSGSFPTTMKFVGGAAGITLTSTNAAIDRIDYIVLNSTTVTCNFTANYVQ